MIPLKQKPFKAQKLLSARIRIEDGFQKRDIELTNLGTVESFVINKDLQTNKFELIVCGDLNTEHDEIERLCK